MTFEFIFAEHVRRLIRSGKKEIEVPEGARISSAAADLIKEHSLHLKTVAPASISNPPQPAEVEPTVSNEKATVEKEAADSVKSADAPSQSPVSADMSEAEIEAIVNRVLERFQQLKDKPHQKEPLVEAVSKDTQESETADDDLIICRCEEITRGEIKEVIRNGIRTMNGIKRITRAGMGLCQGQTCQNLVARILAEELGLSPADIDPTTARGPVRPLPLAVFANS